MSGGFAIRSALATALLLVGSAASSRSESAVAYLRLTDGFWQVWSYSPRTDEHRQLTHSPCDKDRPSWGPDGSLVFRNSSDELYRLAPEGGPEQPWRPDAWPAADPVHSPQAGIVAIARLRTELRDASAIWALGPGERARRVLTIGPGVRMHLAWSPDGSAIAYVRSFGRRRSQLRLLRVADSSSELLHEDAFHHAYPAFSPDGRSLAYASDRSGDYEIWVRELASGAEHQLTSHPGLDTAPTWSPDGARIAFTSQREGRLQIWCVARDGTDGRALFSLDTDARSPAWR